MKFSPGPERDETVFTVIQQHYGDDATIMELLSIAKKWRSKAMMREVRIEELENERRE